MAHAAIHLDRVLDKLGCGNGRICYGPPTSAIAGAPPQQTTAVA
jgi:hypothetical protein